MVSSPVTVLVFDVFGTVVDWRTSIAREAKALLAPYVDSIDAYALADAWRKGYEPAMNRIRTGDRPFVILDVLHRENLDAALRQCGIAAETVPTSILDNLNQAWHRLSGWPDSSEGLRRLKQRFLLAPLSNGNVRMMFDIARSAHLSWDAILGAEVARAYKPSPDVYLKAVEMMNVQPSQMCLVAAHNYDLDAARACGLRTAFIARPTEYGENQRTDLVPTSDWDYVASDLIELAVVLGA